MPSNNLHHHLTASRLARTRSRTHICLLKGPRPNLSRAPVHKTDSTLYFIETLPSFLNPAVASLLLRAHLSLTSYTRLPTYHLLSFPSCPVSSSSLNTIYLPAFLPGQKSYTTLPLFAILLCSAILCYLNQEARSTLSFPERHWVANCPPSLIASISGFFVRLVYLFCFATVTISSPTIDSETITMDFTGQYNFTNPQPYHQFMPIPPLTPSHSHSAGSDDFNASPPVSKCSSPRSLLPPLPRCSPALAFSYLSITLSTFSLRCPTSFGFFSVVPAARLFHDTSAYKLTSGLTCT